MSGSAERGASPQAVRFARVTVALGGAAFAGIGLAFLLFPESLAAVVELDASSVTARNDVRAVFGGLELGVAVFLFAAGLRRSWLRAGLALQILGFGGLAVGRLTSTVLDGAPASISWWLLAGEVTGLSLGAIAWSRIAPGDGA